MSYDEMPLCCDNGGLHNFDDIYGVLEVTCRCCANIIKTKAKTGYNDALLNYVKLNLPEYKNVCWHNYNHVYNKRGDVACSNCGSATNDEYAEGYMMAKKHIVNILVGAKSKTKH